MNQKAMSLVEIIISMVILSAIALGVVATMSLITSQQMRSASGSLDILAMNYARETVEKLKNAVSTESPRGDALIDADGLGPNPSTYTDALPAGDLANSPHNGTRTYRVWDVDLNGDGVADWKKVTVEVTWTA